MAFRQRIKQNFNKGDEITVLFHGMEIKGIVSELILNHPQDSLVVIEDDNSTWYIPISQNIVISKSKLSEFSDEEELDVEERDGETFVKGRKVKEEDDLDDDELDEEEEEVQKDIRKKKKKKKKR
jgi:hypothetical protein